MTEHKMCDYKMCSQKAKWVESYKGELFNLCTAHRRLINKQKKADNNI